jgi:hypothetical protein
MARSLALLESTGYPSPFRGAVACEELNGAGDRGALVAALGRFGRPARSRRTGAGENRLISAPRGCGAGEPFGLDL